MSTGRSITELYDELMELRHPAPAVEVVDALEFATDIVTELRMDDEDDLPIVDDDIDLLILPSDPVRMVPRKKKEDESERSITNLYAELMELRYSPDQPRRPNGQFGFGDSDPGKHASFGKEDEKNFKAAVHEWVRHAGNLQQQAAKDIKAGKAGTNLLLAGIREERLEGTIYRGLENVDAKTIASLQTKDTLDLIPQSFTADKDVAEIYSGRDADDRRGNSVVYVAGVTNGIRVSDYTSRHVVAGEKEVITAGRFKINSVTMKNSIYYVKLKQVGTF